MLLCAVKLTLIMHPLMVVFCNSANISPCSLTFWNIFIVTGTSMLILRTQIYSWVQEKMKKMFTSWIMVWPVDMLITLELIKNIIQIKGKHMMALCSIHHVMLMLEVSISFLAFKDLVIMCAKMCAF